MGPKTTTVSACVALSIQICVLLLEAVDVSNPCPTIDHHFQFNIPGYSAGFAVPSTAPLAVIKIFYFAVGQMAKMITRTKHSLEPI